MSPDAPAPLVPVQVRLMGRTLSLRVRAGDEEKLRAWATELDARLSEFRRAYPTQPETVAVLTVALALAEEVHTLREAAAQQHGTEARFADALVALDLRLAAALTPRAGDAADDDGEEAWDDEAPEADEDADGEWPGDDGEEGAEPDETATPAPPSDGDVRA